MPKIESYKHGTPSWVDLSTSDQEAAKGFYACLFEWEYEDNDVGNGQYYSMAKIGKSSAGAIATQQPEEAQQGVPPHWNVYITVDDVDAVAEKVPSLDGTVLMAPMDVFDAGRMIVVRDSVGAVVMFWQPKQHIGAEVRDEHGALTWTLVLTTDKDASASFYSDLLDIEVVKDAMSSPDGGTVHQLLVDGQPVASIMNMPQQVLDMGVPPHWEVYFRVDDAQAVCDAVAANGGQVYMGPADLGPIGTIGYMQDPQGAQFGVQQPSE
jgi:predicted enzyme related to lactoylglutathione lyase